MRSKMNRTATRKATLKYFIRVNIIVPVSKASQP